MSNKHFVYLYRDSAGTAKYVGYGQNVERALSHSGKSHNSRLKAWLEKDNFDLSIAGPYRSESEAKVVEAALISSMNPEFNIAPGDGPKFSPVGVPPELWERPQMKPLTLGEIGRKTGGALLVYLSAGDFLRDGRRKFNAALPSDSDAVSNIEKTWDIGSLVEQWKTKPELIPNVLIGIHGKVQHRFIIGALEIDQEHLCESEYIRHAQRWARPRRQVPLVDSSNLDMNELRGRRVDGIKFGAFSHQLHIWVDKNGRKRHPISRPK
jgi:hypothetical protein